jgi:hypothetical protein
MRSGMCNRLFIWAHALVFSHCNQLPLFVHGWYKTPIGPWLRNERTKRFYFFYFRHQTDFAGYYLRKILGAASWIYNPPVKDEVEEKKIKGIEFNELPHFNHYFDQLNGYNNLIAAELDKMLSPGILKRLSHIHPPAIGVHIRRGDFAGNPMLERLSFFISAILYVRNTYGNFLPVMVFSDGYEEELREILALPGVELYRGKTDIEELIMLSKSQFIITSLGSTYSYWAGFLSNAVIIHSPRYEGTPSRWSALRKEGNLIIEEPEDSFKKLTHEIV